MRENQPLEQLAMTAIVCSAGGRLVVTDAALSALPLGTLSVQATPDGNMDVIYKTHEHAELINDAASLALAIIVHQAGGKLRLVNIEKLPNGFLKMAFGEGYVEFLYEEGTVH